MAAVTLLGTVTFNTTAGTKTVTATPAANDLIVIVTAHSGNTSTTTPPTDNNSDGNGTYVLITSALKATSADVMCVWVRKARIISATSTVFTHAPGTTTGGGLAVLKVTGMTLAGLLAALHSGASANQASGGTPSVSLGSAANTNNPVIGAVFSATNSTTTVANNASYTEVFDNGYATPTSGLEVMTRDSGETGSSVSWGGTVASAFCAVLIELDVSNPTATAVGLTDNFDDNSLSADWTSGNFLDPAAATTGVTVAEANQRTEVTGPASTAAVRYSGRISAISYDVTDKAIYLKIGNAESASGSELAYLAFGTDVNNHYDIIVSPSGGYHFDFRKVVAGGANTIQTFFLPAGEKWFRIRHWNSRDAILVDTAPSTASDAPISGDWVHRVSATRDSSALTLATAKLAFGGGLFGSVVSPLTFQFDGFNTATTSPGTTVSPSTGHIVLAGHLPTVTKEFNIGPSGGHLTLGGKVATVSVAFNIAPSTGHLVLTGYSPTILVGTSVNPSTGHLTLSGHAPTITLAVNIAPATGHLTLGGKVPTVTKAFNLSPSAGHLTLGGKTPSVTLTVNINPATGHLLLTGYTPTVDNGGVVAPTILPIKVTYRHRGRNC